MGIFDFLKSSDEATPARIQRAVKAVTEPHGEAAVRMAAADRLRGWKTPEAVAGLLRRFTIHTPSGQVDLDECQEVERMLVELGPVIVEPILKYLSRESAVAYPARALRKVLTSDEYVLAMLGVLAKLEAGFGSYEDQRVGLLRALDDVDDPRSAAGALRFLEDPVDDVVIAAMACVTHRQDATYCPDLVRLLAQCGDRPRVRQAVAEELVRLGWPLGEERKQAMAALPRGFSLDKKGRVVEVG